MSSSYRITLEEVLASLPGEISLQMWKKNVAFYQKRGVKQCKTSKFSYSL